MWFSLSEIFANTIPVKPFSLPFNRIKLNRVSGTYPNEIPSWLCTSWLREVCAITLICLSWKKGLSISECVWPYLMLNAEHSWIWWIFAARQPLFCVFIIWICCWNCFSLKKSRTLLHFDLDPQLKKWNGKHIPKDTLKFTHTCYLFVTGYYRA